MNITSKAILLFLSAFVFFCGSLQATDVCGNLSSDAVWTVSGSPYVVTCTVGITSGKMLTIDPGVTVQFTSGTYLSVVGRLTAIGTAASPICSPPARPLRLQETGAQCSFS